MNKEQQYLASMSVFTQSYVDPSSKVAKLAHEKIERIELTRKYGKRAFGKRKWYYKPVVEGIRQVIANRGLNAVQINKLIEQECWRHNQDKKCITPINWMNTEIDFMGIDLLLKGPKKSLQSVNIIDSGFRVGITPHFWVSRGNRIYATYIWMNGKVRVIDEVALGIVSFIEREIHQQKLLGTGVLFIDCNRRKYFFSDDSCQQDLERALRRTKMIGELWLHNLQK